jgi:predicted RNase H-like HicB family nuclease
VKTYIFRVEIEQEEDGRWSADIPTLPGCAAWAYTKEEALEAIQDTAQAYLEVLFEDGRPLPKEAEETTQVSEVPLVAVTA